MEENENPALKDAADNLLKAAKEQDLFAFAVISDGNGIRVVSEIVKPWLGVKIESIDIGKRGLVLANPEVSSEELRIQASKAIGKLAGLMQVSAGVLGELNDATEKICGFLMQKAALTPQDIAKSLREQEAQTEEEIKGGLVGIDGSPIKE